MSEQVQDPIVAPIVIEPPVFVMPVIEPPVFEPIAIEPLPPLPSDYNHQAVIADLWTAADQYIAKSINGVGIGLFAAGLVAQKPKAAAVTAWTQAVWMEYYARKALWTEGGTLPNLDFSTMGEMPHTVLELSAELFE